MNTALIICSNLVAVAIVVYAIFSLEAQEFSLRLILPKYPTLNIEGAEKVDKKILIDAIDVLNSKYAHTETVYKNALVKRFNYSYSHYYTTFGSRTIIYYFDRANSKSSYERQTQYPTSQ